MPLLPSRQKHMGDDTLHIEDSKSTSPAENSTPDLKQMRPSSPPSPTRVKNRRKRYLDLHADYFSPSLELADPLLYDRLVRRFQSTGEREAEGRAKGYSGILEADLMRSEAKISALANPNTNTMFTYKRGENGEILAEEKDEVPTTKEEGLRRWKWEMELRFLRGKDEDFDYGFVDKSEEWDDWEGESREKLEEWLEEEEPQWIAEDGTQGVDMEIHGQTGVQDY